MIACPVPDPISSFNFLRSSSDRSTTASGMPVFIIPCVVSHSARSLKYFRMAATVGLSLSGVGIAEASPPHTIS